LAPLRAERFHATIAPAVVLGVALNIADRSDPGALRERSAERRGCASGDGHDDAPCAGRSWRDSSCHYPCRSWAGWPPQTDGCHNLRHGRVLAGITKTNAAPERREGGR